MTTKKGDSAITPSGERQIALLRGVNVGGKNRLAMKDLVAMLESAGCSDVETYIQSGNAVFMIPASRAKNFHSEVQRALTAKLGKEIPLVLRTSKELRAVARANPFLAAGADPAFLHVGFLADTPHAAHVAALDIHRSKPDEFVVRGREIFLHTPKGIGKSKLTNDYFDRSLKTTSTVRNWRTVLALLEMAEGKANS